MKRAKILRLTQQPNLNNDCAPITARHDDCAPADAPLRSQIKSATTMQHVPGLYIDSLPGEHTLVFSPFAPSGAVVLNAPAWARLQQFSDPQYLHEPIDFNFAENNLIAPAGTLPAIEWGSPTTLTAWLHVTNACNLDCPSCYIQKSSARMDADIGHKVIDAIFQSALKNGFRHITLKYAGGEAALHFSIVKLLHAHAQSLARQHNIRLEGVVLSNGTTWTHDMAMWLKDNHITLVISVDGVGKVHDVLRPTVANEGSFQQIEYVIDQVLHQAGIRPEISVTVSGVNAHHLSDVVRWAMKRNLKFNLNFYRANKLSSKFEVLEIEETQIIEGFLAAYQLIETQMSKNTFIGGLLDRTQLQAHSHTCGVGQNYLVFSHTGALAQCQMAQEYAVPFSSDVDPLMLVGAGHIPHLSVDEKTGCQSCVWRYYCAGGCPLETYRTTGRFDVKSPHCKIYTTLFPYLLRLQGLYLLKSDGYL